MPLRRPGQGRAETSEVLGPLLQSSPWIMGTVGSLTYFADLTEPGRGLCVVRRLGGDSLLSVQALGRASTWGEQILLRGLIQGLSLG